MLICQIGFNSGVEMTVNFHMTFCALLPCLLFVFWVELSIVMTFMRTKMWNWNICIAAVFPYFRPNIDVGGWSQGAKNNFCSPKKGKVSSIHEKWRMESHAYVIAIAEFLLFHTMNYWRHKLGFIDWRMIVKTSSQILRNWTTGIAKMLPILQHSCWIVAVRENVKKKFKNVTHLWRLEFHSRSTKSQKTAPMTLEWKFKNTELQTEGWGGDTCCCFQLGLG